MDDLKFAKWEARGGEEEERLVVECDEAENGRMEMTLSACPSPAGAARLASTAAPILLCLPRSAPPNQGWSKHSLFAFTIVLAE
jgi:hypothetical protein